jgi:hypothetical protein
VDNITGLIVAHALGSVCSLHQFAETWPRSVPFDRLGVQSDDAPSRL